MLRLRLCANQMLWIGVSALASTTDFFWRATQVRFVPIVLKKSFLADEQQFLGPLMRSVRGDVRDHIVTPKTDHGSS
jgi:hypothetical protein